MLNKKVLLYEKIIINPDYIDKVHQNSMKWQNHHLLAGSGGGFSYIDEDDDEGVEGP